MKKLITLIFLLGTFFVPIENNEPNLSDSNVPEFLISFKNGSSRELVRYFEQSVTININGKNGDYSRNQAEFVLEDFFRKNPPLDFYVLHQGGNPGPTVFYLARYYSNQKTYKVLVKGNQKTESLKIFSIDILI